MKSFLKQFKNRFKNYHQISIILFFVIILKLKQYLSIGYHIELSPVISNYPPHFILNFSLSFIGKLIKKYE